MKLLLLFLLLPLIGKAQYKYDTVRVIMLVCDTIGTRPFDSQIANSLCCAFPPVYWKFGYSVREQKNIIHPNGEIIYTTDNAIVGDLTIRPEWYWEHIIYLDKNKKPLRQNIVVWMTKEINN